MTKTSTPPRKAIYPRPGSHADTILSFIKLNEGTTTNRIITKLGLNPSVVRKALATLVQKERILDEMDGEGNHNWRIRGVL